MRNRVIRLVITTVVVSWGVLLNLNLSAQASKGLVPDLRRELRLIRVIDTPMDRFGHIYFNNTGERIVTTGNSHGIRIFNANNGRLETSISPCNGKKFLRVPFIEDYNLFAVGCFGSGIAEIWNIRRSQRVRQFRMNILGAIEKDHHITASISPNSAVLVLENSHEEPTELWHIEAGTKIATLTPFLTKGARNSDTVAFSPDSRIVAVSYNADLYLWDVQTGEMLFYLLDSAKNLKLPGGIVAAHRNPIYYLLFSHDGKHLFSGSIDSHVKQWSVSTGKLVQTFSGHSARISSLALSPDGKTLATGSHDKKAKLWEAETGRLLWTSPDHRGYVWKIFFSPDGKKFLTMTGSRNIGGGNEIIMWETATGKPLGKMSGFWWQSFFSPDWRYFVTVGKKKKTIELYEFLDRIQP